MASWKKLLAENSSGVASVSSKLGVGTSSPTARLEVVPASTSLTDNSALGLYIKGQNGGIKIGRHSDNNHGAYTHIYTDVASTDFCYIRNNGGDTGGVATDKIAGADQNPVNNYIQFSGYNKIFSRMGTTQLTMGSGKVYYENVNVGIGTTSPSKLLHLESADNDILQIENSQTDYSSARQANIKFVTNSTISNLNIGNIGYQSTDNTWDGVKFIQQINNGNSVQTIAENIRGNEWKWYTGGTVRMTLSSNGPSVSNIYTPSIVAAGGSSLNMIASGTSVSIGADYDSTYGNVDIYPTGKNIGTAKTVRFNPDKSYFYKPIYVSSGNINVDGGGIGINITGAPDNPLHIENGSNGMASIRLEDARTGDTSISAGGYLAFYANHHTTNKHLGNISYSQTGTHHNAVKFQIAGTLAGVGGKKLITNDDNGVWKFYNNYTEDEAMIIKNSQVGINTFTPERLLHLKQGADDNGIRLSGHDDMANRDADIHLDSYGQLNIRNNVQSDGLANAHINFATNQGGAVYMYPQLRVGNDGISTQGAVDLKIGGNYDSDIKLLNASGNPVLTVDAGTSKVGIGTTSPTEALHVEGKAYIRRTGSATAHADTDLFVADSTADSSTAQMQILGGAEGSSNLYFSDTASYSVGGLKYIHSSNHMHFRLNDADKMTLNNNGLGIGMNSPTQKLVVYGSIMLDSWIRGYENATAHTYERNWLSFDSGSPIYRTGSDDKYHRIQNYSGTNIMSIGGANNRVGIGTDTPLANLHIYKNTTTNNDKLFRVYNGSGLQWEIQGDGSMSGYLGNSISSVTELKGAWMTDLKVSGGDASSEAEAGDVIFKTNNVEKARLTNTGRLGIGTTSPSAPLHVVGGIRTQSANNNISFYLANNSTRLMEFKNMGDNSTILKTSGAYNLRFGTNDADRLMIQQGTGNVGIGTTSPSHRLHVKGSGNTNQSLFLITDSDDNSQFRIDTSSADGSPNMRLYDTSGSSKVVFNSNGSSKIMGGNVGIGTDSPSRKLHIAGSGTEVYGRISNSGANSYAGLEFLNDVGSYTVGIRNDDKFAIANNHSFGGGYSLVLDSSTRISTSTNDLGTQNTIFGYTAGNAIASGAQGNSAFGHEAMITTTTGDRNTAIGYQSLRHNATGGENTAIGYEALRASSGNSTHNNTSIGAYTMYSLSTGNENIAVGNQALYYNATGTKNTAIGRNSMFGASAQSHTGNTGLGYKTLEAITTGNYNVGIGMDALKSITTGGNNIAIGYGALDALTTTNNMVAIGYNAGTTVAHSQAEGGTYVGYKAGEANYSAGHTTAIGYEALMTVTANGYNTAVGSQALKLATGVNNTAVGASALMSVTTGHSNTAMGRQAGDAIVSGEQNSLFGYQAGTSLQLGRYNSAFGYQSLNSDQHGSYSTAIGYKALYAQLHGTVNGDTGNTGVGIGAGYHNVTGTNNTYIGSQSGQGASGNSNSSNTGVGSNTLTNVTTGYSNVTMGYEAGNYITSGHENTFIGTGAGRRIQTGDENVGIGHYALSDAVTGDANVGVGYKALGLLTSGVDNVAVGNEAGGAVTTGSYNIFMGDHNIGSSGMNNHTILGVPDTDRTTILGRTALHSTSSDYATISHYEYRYSGVSYGFRQAADGSTNINSKDNTQIYFSVNNASKATIKGNYLGVGTTNPSQKLDVVSGTIKADAIMYHGALNVTASRLYGNGANTYFDSAYQINFRSGSTPAQAMIIKTDGKVGIGTTTPGTLLQVGGAATFDGATTIGNSLDVQGDCTFDSGLEVGGQTNFQDSVDFGQQDVAFTNSTVTGLNVSVVPSALRVIESSACNVNQNVNDATENIYWKTMSTHNTSHITWADGQGGYYFEFDTAGEYMVYCTLVVTDSASNDRLNWVTYVTHMNSSNTEIYSYGIGGGYIRDDHSPYDSAGHGGGVRLIVNANDRVKINTKRLDTETTSGNAYLNTTESKIKIDKITYSTT